MRKSVISLMTIVGAAVLIGFIGPLWAQTPPISVTVTFDKDYFDSGEPMGVTIKVTNTSEKYLLVNKGFSSKLFYLEMRLIDPAGRLVQPKCEQPRTEFPDTPPLAFVDCNGTPTQVANYEVLPPELVCDSTEGRSQGLLLNKIIRSLYSRGPAFGDDF